MPRTRALPALPSLLLALLLAGAALQAQEAAPAGPGVTTVVLVRHAEKVDESRDPELSPAGRKRAEALAAALDGAEVGAIYVTQFQRTRLTAAPLAGRLGLAAQERPVGEDVAASVRELATEVLTRQAGRTVLVVGHSNTLPPLVQALTGLTVAPISDPVYDHFYVVVVPAGGGPARLFQSRYGAPSGS